MSTQEEGYTRPTALATVTSDAGTMKVNLAGHRAAGCNVGFLVNSTVTTSDRPGNTVTTVQVQLDVWNEFGTTASCIDTAYNRAMLKGANPVYHGTYNTSDIYVPMCTYIGPGARVPTPSGSNTGPWTPWSVLGPDETVTGYCLNGYSCLDGDDKYACTSTNPPDGLPVYNWPDTETMSYLYSTPHPGTIYILYAVKLMNAAPSTTSGLASTRSALTATTPTSTTTHNSTPESGGKSSGPSATQTVAIAVSVSVGAIAMFIAVFFILRHRRRARRNNAATVAAGNHGESGLDGGSGGAGREMALRPDSAVLPTELPAGDQLKASPQFTAELPGCAPQAQTDQKDAADRHLYA